MNRSTLVKSRIILLAVTLLLSRCVLVPVMEETPVATSNGNSASGSGAGLGTYTISLQAEEIMGRTDVNGDPTTAKFVFSVNGQAASLPIGATVQCRTYPVNGSTTAFSSCVPNGSGNIALSFDATKPIGRYKTEARISYQGNLSNAASVTYYVHSNLDGATKCAAPVSAENYFTAASQVLPMGASFASGTNFNAPFYQIKFDASSVYRKNTQTASLRRQFVMNQANSLILIKRRYSTSWGNCGNGMRMWQRGNQQKEYDAVVVDAKGNWVGFQNNTATVTGSGANAASRFGDPNNAWGSFYNYSGHKVSHSYTTDINQHNLFDSSNNGVIFVADE